MILPYGPTCARGVSWERGHPVRLNDCGPAARCGQDACTGCFSGCQEKPIGSLNTLINIMLSTLFLSHRAVGGGDGASLRALGRRARTASGRPLSLECQARDAWIGWTLRHKYDRLHLVANNTRFPLLHPVPNFGSRVLGLCARRVRRPEQTPLYALFEEHFPRFLQRLEAEASSLPHFVKEEFEAYLKCGRLEYGFLRVRCDACGHEKLVAFSCKRRGLKSMLRRTAHGGHHRSPRRDRHTAGLLSCLSAACAGVPASCRRKHRQSIGV